MYGDAGNLEYLAAEVFRKTTVAVTHVRVFLRHRGKFQHILLPVIEDGDLLAVRAGVCLVPFWHTCKVNNAHVVTPFPSADTSPGDTTPVLN